MKKKYHTHAFSFQLCILHVSVNLSQKICIMLQFHFCSFIRTSKHVTQKATNMQQNKGTCYTRAVSLSDACVHLRQISGTVNVVGRQSPYYTARCTIFSSKTFRSLPHDYHPYFVLLGVLEREAPQSHTGKHFNLETV